MILKLTHKEVEFIYNFMSHVTLDVSNEKRPWMLLFADDQPVAKEFVYSPKDEYTILLTDFAEYHSWVSDMDTECAGLLADLADRACHGYLGDDSDYLYDNLKIVSAIIHALKN
jgi:hypothetical protein